MHRPTTRELLNSTYWPLVAANTGAGLFLSAFLVMILPAARSDARDIVWMYVSPVLLVAALAALGRLETARRMRQFSWLDEDRDPDDVEREAVVGAPWAVGTLPARYWLIAALGAAVAQVRLHHGPRFALIAAVGTCLGGLAACAASYLMVERRLRPVIALALSDRPPAGPVTLGVRRRVVVAWALGSGIPLGVLLVTPLAPAASRVPLEAVIAMLSIGGLVGGYLLIAGTARSLAEPLDALRAAVDRVGKGELEVGVAVDDAGEVGMLQAGFNRMVAGLRERERLRDLFGRHVGEEVAREALERGIELGGEQREVTLFYADLIGSTPLAVTRPPHEVVGVLNRLFAAVVAEVTAERGWVDKFVGDEAMCVFGSPGALADHETHALRAARALARALREQHIDAGIGVSSGTVVAGHIGTEARAEYTVIGHPANEAARLTTEAKRRDSRVLASAAAVESATDEESRHWRAAGELELRGIPAPVRVFEPTPERD